MGMITRPSHVKLFAGFFARDASLFPAVKKRLVRAFGPIDYETAVMDFAHTAYYEREFGTGLRRAFVSFARPARLEGVFRAKIVTNRIEQAFARNGARTVNIDPGYLTLSKMALLTTKDYTHRLHLSKGIYAEVTLHFREGTFTAWPWTYPDYRTPAYIAIFNHIRSMHHEQGGTP